MKKILLSIGFILHIIYYIFAILSLGDFEYSGYGIGQAFAFWIYAMIISIPVVIIYLIEGIKTFLICRNLFNFLKLIVVIILIPLFLFIGSSAGVVESVIWNLYFCIVFVIQFISLFVKCIDH